jgi:hypothetical protein
LNSLQAWGVPGREKYVIYPIYFTEWIFYTEAAIKSRKSFPVRGNWHLSLGKRLNRQRIST